MPLLPKAIYRFRAVSIKIPIAVFTELEKTIVKLVWNHKDQKSQSNPQKEEQARGITFPDFKILQSYSDQKV